MTTPGARLTAFSYRRQRLDGSAASVGAALRDVIGVYSAMPGGPLSLRVRALGAGVTADDVRALELDRRAVRMRGMRTSAFLVPMETAALVGAATAVPEGRFRWLLRAAGISEGELPGVRAAVLAAASEPATTAELRARLETVEGGVGDGAGAAPSWTRGEALGRVLSLLTGYGDLVAIGQASLSSNALRYVARETWFAGVAVGDGGPATAPDAAGARAWLAGEYLRAFGPARPEDLAWWAGWTRAVAADALAAHETIDVGFGLLLRAVDLPPFETAEPLRDELTLLPKWDAWTMGYPLGGRDRFLDLDVHDRVFDGDGNGLAMVLRGGRAIGAWAHRLAGGRMQADLDLFERVSSRDRQAIETELEAVGAFLGARTVAVRDVPTVVPDRPRIRRPLTRDGG